MSKHNSKTDVEFICPRCCHKYLINKEDYMTGKPVKCSKCGYIVKHKIGVN